MAIRDVYDNVCATLVNEEYIVNTKPQEKQMLAAKELVVLVTSIDPVVETTTSYIVTVQCKIIWGETDGGDMLNRIIELMSLIESNMSLSNKFKFVKPNIEAMGTLYQIELPFEYTEVLDIGA